MNFRVRDWIPGILLLILLGIDVLGTVVSGLPSGIEIGFVLLLLVVQILWIGIPFVARKAGAAFG